MTLRRRLALTVILTAVPLLVGGAWVWRELRRYYDARITGEIALAHVTALGQAQCESGALKNLLPFPRPPSFARTDGRRERSGPEYGEWPKPGPAHWRGVGLGTPPPAPLQIFGYGENLRSRAQNAPEFPRELLGVLSASPGQPITRRFTRGDSEGLDVAVRTGWDNGGCAVILARRLHTDGEVFFGRQGRGEGAVFLARRVRGDAWALSPAWAALPVVGILLVAMVVAAGPIVHRIRALTFDVRRAAESRYYCAVRVSGNDEVTELAQAFNEVGATVREHVALLEKREQTLRNLLANTTHDVMIPLTVLQGHLSELREAAAVKTAIAESRVLPALCEAQYLASLFHNLGAAAKLEAGEPLVEMHPVDLCALVERVVIRHRAVASPLGVVIEFGVPDSPVIVRGDVTLLEQAVSNLVHNAVRYNRPGGHVAILLVESAEAFLLRVVDDGPGIPEDQRRRLLLRGERGNDARQRDPDGMGLGLHIAQSVAVRHGFRLDLVDAEQGGLEATLRGLRAAA